MRIGKRFRTAQETIGPERLADLNDAVARLKKSATAKFDETVEVAMRLGVDPRHAEQQVRGTVTMDVAKAVREVKAGKIEYRVDKAGNLHAPIGKASFGNEQLVANVEAFLREVLRMKPAASKGQYLRSVTLSSTMGPPVRLDPAALQASLKS